MNNWTTTIVECYCTRKLSIKKSKWMYEWWGNGKTKRVPNKDYDPNYRTPRKPKDCPGKPQFSCLNRNCPHLGYTNAEEEEYLWDNLFFERNTAKRIYYTLKTILKDWYKKSIKNEY